MSVKLVCGDASKTLETIEDQSVDMVLTSPPYDNLRDYDGGFSFDFEAVANQLFRVLKKGGVVIWVVGDATINGSETGTSFKQALYFKSIGFNLYDTMIYRKQNYAPKTHKRYEQEFEFMFCLSKGKPKTFNPIMQACKYAGQKFRGKPSYYKSHKAGRISVDHGEFVGNVKIKGNIFTYLVGSAEAPKYIKHPAVFPMKLALDQISTWSNEADTILDPFVGSGTSAHASVQLKRNFIGIDQSQEYLAMAQRRLGE